MRLKISIESFLDSKNFGMRVFHGFGQEKLAYVGSILG